MNIEEDGSEKNRGLDRLGFSATTRPSQCSCPGTRIATCGASSTGAILPSRTSTTSAHRPPPRRIGRARGSVGNGERWTTEIGRPRGMASMRLETANEHVEQQDGSSRDLSPRNPSRGCVARKRRRAHSERSLRSVYCIAVLRALLCAERRDVLWSPALTSCVLTVEKTCSSES